MKRLLAAALSAAICITASSALAVGAVGTKLVAGIATEEKVTADQSGVCGKNATWTLSGDKLSIGGTGPMASWAMNTDTPWYKYRDAVRSVEIAEGITTIGPGAFADFPNLSRISIPSTVTSISRGAFQKCTSLSSIDLPGNIAEMPSKSVLR